MKQIKFWASLLVLGFNFGFSGGNEAIYTVPMDVNQSFDESKMSFAIENALWIEDGDRFVISYRLPPEIVDRENATIELSGKIEADSTVQVTGNKGHGRCDLQEKVQCHVFYPNLQIDQTLVLDYLDSHYSGEELVERRDIARYFSEIPEGIIRW